MLTGWERPSSFDARTFSENLAAAPPDHRPHARLARRAFRFSIPFLEYPPAARRPRARRPPARLGRDLRQGFCAGRPRRAYAAHPLRELAVAELLCAAEERRDGRDLQNRLWRGMR